MHEYIQEPSLTWVAIQLATEL